MDVARPHDGGTRVSCARALVLAFLATASVLSLAVAPAAAAETTYTKTFDVPAPPASGFAGANGGGDGWALAMTPTQVFNVFHHDGSLQVNCHNQADASDCWGAPKTVTSDAGSTGYTAFMPSLHLDAATGFLYVPSTRVSDDVGGFACIDTTKPADATGAELFCGFTALTAPGGSAYGGMSNGVQVGSKLYAFNVFSNAATDDANKLLCFDLTTKAACAGQPYSVGPVFSQYSQANTISAIGGRVYVQAATEAGYPLLACLDAATSGSCGAAWPVSFSTTGGGPLPLLDTNGATIGVCARSKECFTSAGAPTATPDGFDTMFSYADFWHGPGVTVGTRVYAPATGSGVGCYDFGTGAACPNFPKEFANLGYLYTVNADPQRPTCLWVNADNGSEQLQTFDAYTGGPCGSGPIRVLSSSVVVNDPSCTPSSYTSLQVLSPAPGQYTDGAIDFQDGSGNAIPGVLPHALDGTGTASLTDLNLSTMTPLPQFLITLNNPTTALSNVQLKLTWTGSDAAICGDVLPPPSIPEVPWAALLPVSLFAVAGAAMVRRQRRGRPAGGDA